MVNSATGTLHSLILSVLEKSNNTYFLWIVGIPAPDLLGFVPDLFSSFLTFAHG